MSDAGNNSPLPEGWTAASIESLAEPRGIAYGVLKPGPQTPGGVPMLRVGDVHSGRIDPSSIYRISRTLDDDYRRTKLTGGEVVLSIQGSVGRAAVVPEALAGANLSRTLAMIRLRDPGLARWVHRALESPQAQAAMRSVVGGTTRDSLNLRDLRKIEIPVAPEPTRSRVLDVIEEVMRLEATAGGHLVAAREVVSRFRGAVLAAACSGRLTEPWREDHPDATSDGLVTRLFETRTSPAKRRKAAHHGHGLTSEDQLARLPQTWSLVRLGDILDVGTGATPLRKNRAYYDDGTIPWVTSGAVNARTITEPTQLITPLALATTNVKLFPPGTLLVAMYGEGQTRGRVAELAIEAGTNQAVAAVVFGDETASLQPFIRVFFEDSYQRVRALSAGGVQPNLNLGMIKDTLIPLPPLDEQREIVRHTTAALHTADCLLVQIEQTRATLDRISQAALAKAFRGEILPTEAALAGAKGRDSASAHEPLACGARVLDAPL